MILTITLNPSMDYSYLTNTLKMGKVNRVDNPHISIGGKGINAGRVAAISGEDVILTGVLGGPNGEAILEILKKENRYQLEFLEISGNSRNAVTIMHDNNTHTEIVEKGIYVSEEDERLLYQHINYLLKNNPISSICISGSVNSSNNNFYSNLLDYLRNTLFIKFPILTDVSGKQLLNILENRNSKPTFIKPNTHELSEILNQSFESSESITNALKQELFQGIELIMISRGSHGAIVKHKEQIYEVTIPKIAAINTTGCGDSTVGGMAYALSQGFSVPDAIKYSMACGMSNALFKTNGIINLDTVKDLFKEIKLSENVQLL